MFETSFLLFLKALLLNIILPLIPGILFLWIFFGKKFHGMLLYLLGRFVGVGVVAFTMFNIQFVHFGIGIGEYFFILGLLFVIFTARVIIKKLDVKEYFKALTIKNIFPDIKHSYIHLSLTEKVFTWILTIFGLGFLVVTLIHTSNFPTYADDSFGNRNKPAINTYYDGGIKIFGESTEILGKGRLGYPVYIPVYKATVSHFIGGFNDIYINMRQRLLFAGFMLFVFCITFEKTKNVFYSLLPIGLIVSLPLVFFHTVEGYMELASAAYAFLTIRALRRFIEDEDYAYMSFAFLIGFILSYIKNDGFVVYLPAIFLSFAVLQLFYKTLSKTIQGFFKDTYNLLIFGFFFVFFFLPFLIVKNYYHLGFNQAAGISSGVGISSNVHRNIFDVFPAIFMKMDNYNVILVVLLLFVWLFVRKRKYLSKALKFLVFVPLVVFMVLLSVFLFTDNYRFALDQTTINRVFTIVFILLFGFIGLFLAHKGSD